MGSDHAFSEISNIDMQEVVLNCYNEDSFWM